MKRHFLVALPVIALLCGTVWADSLGGLPDIAVVDDAIVSITYGGTEYVVADGDLMLGTTARYYIDPGTGLETLWAEGDPAPAATVGGTSSPKSADVGSYADDWLFAGSGTEGGMSSIDGIDFQETVFSTLVDTIFVFERGGNDSGTVQAILADSSLGTALTLTKNGDPYADTGLKVGGQKVVGYVLTTDVPVQGLRITASGHDALSISAIPEPATIALLGLGGLALLRRRRS